MGSASSCCFGHDAADTAPSTASATVAGSGGGSRPNQGRRADAEADRLARLEAAERRQQQAASHGMKGGKLQKELQDYQTKTLKDHMNDEQRARDIEAQATAYHHT